MTIVLCLILLVILASLGQLGRIADALTILAKAHVEALKQERDS